MRCAEADVGREIAAVLAAMGATRFVVPAGLPAEWLALARGGAVSDDPPLTHAASSTRSTRVVTGCAIAIAETGTIVLDAGRARAGAS